jgi:hypothetical protein
MKKLVLNLTFVRITCALLILVSYAAYGQNVAISVNATLNKRLISPYIYGKNDFIGEPVQFYKDAGLRFARLNGGNNASAYNWRAKLAVHPDWFNNVYGADWDANAQKINSNFSNLQGMFAFQLLGRVASSGANNFPDWQYMQDHPGWNGYHQNLAGGGTPNPDPSGRALVDGNIDLFSKPWPADSSVAILNHWFGTNGKGFDKNKFVYWSMDNEVDIWSGTHDWAMPTQLSAAAFVDRYIALAKKAKALYPGIKLCGPVNTSEWHWYKWADESIIVNGRYYPWLEYFIKRLGDEYKASGVRLVDVLDIHNYPWYNKDSRYDAEALQGHRIYFDETYDYPGSNGIKTIAGGWDEVPQKQYIFKRVEGWLNEHFGTNHGITTGVSEWGTMSNSNANLESVIYASHLGTFANNGVELFSPWNWSVGMWETLHLFSRNAKKYSVSSTSSLENTVSAYSSINENADSLTVIVVSRDLNGSRTVTINLSNFKVDNGTYQTLQLSSLPATETFVSHTQNAVKQNTATVNSNSLTITVPALSTTAILLKKCAPSAIIPFVQIDGGSWVGTANGSVAAGSTVRFGPQPNTGGSWIWTGPNGFSATTREITISNPQATHAGTYVAKHTNNNGCESTQNFSLSVSSGTGSILREHWTGITGTSVSNLTSNSNYPNSPTGTSQLTSLEAPTNWGDNYGSRIRGYIHPPVTGSYTFWIAGDDNTELYLSTNDNPANRSRISSVAGWTNAREWTKYSTQQSAAIQLTAGQKYYIEVLHKEGTGGDNVAVAWQGPSISQQVIGGSYVSPYVPAITVRARGTVGGETIDLRVNGNTIATWTLTTSYTNYTASGNGAVTVHFTNDSGQRDVQVDYVTIGSLTYQSEVQATNTGVWSGTCGGSNSEWLNCNGYISYTSGGTSAASVSSTEAAEVKNADAISLYPNPNGGSFTILLPEFSGNAEVEIYDQQGRLVFEKAVSGDNMVELESGLKPGLYAAKINWGAFSLSKKFIVK